MPYLGGKAWLSTSIERGSRPRDALVTIEDSLKKGAAEGLVIIVGWLDRLSRRAETHEWHTAIGCETRWIERETLAVGEAMDHRQGKVWPGLAAAAVFGTDHASIRADQASTGELRDEVAALIREIRGNDKGTGVRQVINPGRYICGGYLYPAKTIPSIPLCQGT